MINRPEVFIFTNETSETSISLEIASRIPSTEVSQTIHSFFEPTTSSFGLEVHSLNATSQLDIPSYMELYQSFRTNKPDIVHIHPNATGSIARVLAKAAGISHIITTEHNTHTNFSTIKNIVNGSTNWLNNIVVCNSKATANSFYQWEDWLLEASHAEKTVIYNGVNIERLDEVVAETSVKDNSPAETRNKTISANKTKENIKQKFTLPDGFLVGTAARLVRQKHLSTLIRATANLIDRYPDIHLVIVGDGPRREALETLANQLGIEDNVFFLGYVPRRSDVHAIMHILDVYAFPSRYEGFGVAVAEAMAAGCPPVVSDIPVLHEVVGDTGTYINPDNTEEFASALENLYRNKEERQRLGQAASEHIRTQFTIQKCVDDYVKLYQKLAES